MKTLHLIKGNSASLTMLERAKDILNSIGFIDFLREKSVPIIHGLGDNTQALATQAARSAGYIECLYDILYFKERYWKESKTESDKPFADFGGIEASIKQGYITEEEGNELRKSSTNK